MFYNTVNLLLYNIIKYSCVQHNISSRRHPTETESADCWVSTFNSLVTNWSWISYTFLVQIQKYSEIVNQDFIAGTNTKVQVSLTASHELSLSFFIHNYIFHCWNNKGLFGLAYLSLSTDLSFVRLFGRNL